MSLKSSNFPGLRPEPCFIFLHKMALELVFIQKLAHFHLKMSKFPSKIEQVPIKKLGNFHRKMSEFPSKNEQICPSKAQIFRGSAPNPCFLFVPQKTVTYVFHVLPDEAIFNSKSANFRLKMSQFVPQKLKFFGAPPGAPLACFLGGCTPQAPSALVDFNSPPDKAPSKT